MSLNTIISVMSFEWSIHALLLFLLHLQSMFCLKVLGPCVVTNTIFGNRRLFDDFETI